MTEEEKSASGGKPSLEKEATPELKVTEETIESSTSTSSKGSPESNQSKDSTTKESASDAAASKSVQDSAPEQAKDSAQVAKDAATSSSLAKESAAARTPILTPKLAAEAITGLGGTTGSRSTPQSPAAAGGIGQRRSPWESSLAALRYIGSISRDDELRVRDSDRATSIFLLLSSILTVLSLLLKPLAAYRLPFVLVCDVLVGAMLVFYVINRFGIINTLTPRQALLTWQLMMGSAFIGIFMTINMAVVIALAVANTSIDIR